MTIYLECAVRAVNTRAPLGSTMLLLAYGETPRLRRSGFDSGFGVKGQGSRIKGQGSRVKRQGSRVKGLGFRVSGTDGNERVLVGFEGWRA